SSGFTGSDVVDSKRLMCGTRRLVQCSGMSPEQTAQVRRPALPRAFGFVSSGGMRTLDPAAQMSVLVRGGLVTDDGEADDLPVLDAEVVGHDQFVWEVGLVVGAVVAGADDRLAVVVDDLLHVHRDVVSNHFLGDPRADRVDAVDLAASVVDVGVVGKGGGGSVDVERVDRCEVLGDWACELGGHDPCSSLLMTCRAQRGPSRTRRVKGESRA